MKRVRISKGRYFGENSFHAEIRALGVSGSIEKRYISKEKAREVEENGYAYVNQPKERIV